MSEIINTDLPIDGEALQAELFDRPMRERAKGWADRAVADAYLAQAILDEQKVLDEVLTPKWVEDYGKWVTDQPTIEVWDEVTQEMVNVVVDAPETPVPNLDLRRRCYQEDILTYEINYFNELGNPIYTYDDITYTTTITPNTEPKSNEDIIKYHEELAARTRTVKIHDLLAWDDTFVDIGAGKDGVLGITNLKDTLLAIDLGADTTNGIPWIMYDNNVRILMPDDIRALVLAFALRKGEVFTAYGMWRASDKLTPFE